MGTLWGALQSFTHFLRDVLLLDLRHPVGVYRRLAHAKVPNSMRRGLASSRRASVLQSCSFSRGSARVGCCTDGRGGAPSLLPSCFSKTLRKSASPDKSTDRYAKR